MSHPDDLLTDGAHLDSRGREAQLPPEADDSAEWTRVVGWTHVGDFCHVPITLLRPDMVPAEMLLQPTAVKLRTVTGDLTPMLGRGTANIRVGGMTVECKVWVAAVQDQCILGLDFLRASQCVLDLGGNTLEFPGGPKVSMVRATRTQSLPRETSRAVEMQQDLTPPYSIPLPTTLQSKIKTQHYVNLILRRYRLLEQSQKQRL
uniref:Aspartic peptidase DDI1-type domain-containing protein n=1 Tax=Oryzias latipes TaxID=8090 RepID=A0A3P9LQH9_ORYLA